MEDVKSFTNANMFTIAMSRDGIFYLLVLVFAVRKNDAPRLP